MQHVLGQVATVKKKAIVCPHCKETIILSEEVLKTLLKDVWVDPKLSMSRHES